MAASSKARGPPTKDNSGKHPVLLTKGKIELHIGMKIEAMDYQGKWWVIVLVWYFYLKVWQKYNNTLFYVFLEDKNRLGREHETFFWSYYCFM